MSSDKTKRDQVTLGLNDLLHERDAQGFEDLDSLDKLDFFLAVQGKFGVIFSDATMLKLNSLEDVALALDASRN